MTTVLPGPGIYVVTETTAPQLEGTLAAPGCKGQRCESETRPTAPLPPRDPRGCCRRRTTVGHGAGCALDTNPARTPAQSPPPGQRSPLHPRRRRAATRGPRGEAVPVCPEPLSAERPRRSRRSGLLGQRYPRSPRGADFGPAEWRPGRSVARSRAVRSQLPVTWRSSRLASGTLQEPARSITPRLIRVRSARFRHRSPSPALTERIPPRVAPDNGQPRPLPQDADPEDPAPRAPSAAAAGEPVDWPPA